MNRFANYCLALCCLVLINACDKDKDDNTKGPDQTVYGLTDANELVVFNANAPGKFTSKTAITGVTTGEKLLSIDFRPATGELYALSNASKLYVINSVSAAARMVSNVAFSPVVSGNIVSIDFNPSVDRIRLVSNTGQNLRIHPETGVTVNADKTINGGTNPAITGIAYTNSMAGATATALYDIDMTSGKLYRVDLPNDGTLIEVGSLGITFTGQAGFDINADNKIVLLTAKSGADNVLYSVDVNTGKAAKIGNLAQALVDIAIPTPPVAYAADANNNLYIFDPTNPSPITKPILGLQSGETILGIDFRPATGQLYGLGSSSRLYTFNLGSGLATQVGSLTLTPALSGTDFGFDFNPSVDRIRVVSNTGQNLRLDPVNGIVASPDGALNPGSPQVSAAAYNNNVAGTTTTSLFVIDHNADKLYLQNPPNNGTLVEIGALGVDITSANGFDIGGTSNKAWLMATSAGTTKIYSLNTSTGAATAPVNFPNAVKCFAVGLGF